MVELAEILPSRLRQRLDELGKSPRAVSLEIGAHAGYVRDLLDPERFGVPSAERMEALATALGTTTDWLMGRVENSAPVLSEVGLADRALPFHGRTPEEPGIPLVGTGDCADLEVIDETGNTVDIERSSFDPEYHIRFITRPPALRGDRSAYAIYFHGTSMEPRFLAGEVGIAQPSRPAAAGDYVVVQLSDGNGNEVITVLVKKLVRQTAKEVVLEQHNPPLTFSLPRRQVVRMHRIVPPTEYLLG